MTYNPDFPDYVPADEEAASMAGIELAPWVAAMAAPIRAAHIRARMAESNATSCSKANSWRRGETVPIGTRRFPLESTPGRATIAACRTCE